MWKKQTQQNDRYNLHHSLNGFHTNVVTSLIQLENEDLVSGCKDCTINIFSYDSARDEFQLKQTLNQHSYTIWDLINISNGLFASGSEDGSIRLFRLG